MSLTKIGSIGINTGIQLAGVTTIATLNASDNVLSVGGTVNFVSDVSIGGTVSIAGTLTYEDVTNIDAVGLITARNGILVGSGITNPSSPLQIINSSDASIRIYDNTGASGDISAAGWKFRALAGNAATNANGLQISHGTTERIHITTDGNIGIGTDAPENDFHIKTGSATMKLTSTNSATSARLIIESEDDSYGGVHFGDPSDEDAGRIRYYHGGSYPNSMRFYTAASERIIITGTGKVNIGGDYGQTTRQLSVVSSAEQVATFEYSGADADGSEVRFYHNSSSPADDDTLAMLQFSGKNNADEVTMYSSISAESSDVTNGTEDGNIIFSTRAAGAFASRARITSSGRFLVGTDSPLADGDGYIQASVGGSSLGAFLSRSGTTSSRKHIRFNNTSGEVGSISTSGSNIVIAGESDYRLKENVVTLSNAITRLKTLKPYRFNFKSDPNTTLDGFLAHELTTVPIAIVGEKDAVVTQEMIDSGDYKPEKLNDPIYQQLDTTKLIPLLTAALQEAITEIETLKAKVAALEG